MANENTLLTLSGAGLPVYASRQLRQTLEPIQAAGNVRRNWNGDLVDLSLARFRKYRSTISGEDVDPPAFDGQWQGLTVTVDCIVELGYKTAGGSPAKTVVPGSSRVEGDYTYYRPRLTMKIIAFNQELDEWQLINSWELELEEV
jgi:hypothetical protein